MTQQPDSEGAPSVLPALKIAEPEVDAKNPWGDDVLERKEIADRLTTIVRGQQAPFVISVDGRWGTGKTFLLTRWRQDLGNHGWRAIYFNAWEDDFNDDPLLAIIGQLSEYFNEGPLREMARGVAGAIGHVLVRRVTGASPDDLTPDSLLNDYREGLRTKSAVKNRLEQLSKQVRDDTGQPLVFIIDELDRCRPTFAIELLERVKHIFDVPNIVFVFGINREELTKSLRSVYGEIEAEEYLRRFVDLPLVLPDADPDTFCTHLIRSFGLDTFFASVRTTGSRNTFQIATEYLPLILGGMGLSLRDMDHCVRLLAFAARTMAASRAFPASLLVLLIAVRIQNPKLYREYIEGTARGAALLDCLKDHRRFVRAGNLQSLEAVVYAMDDAETVVEQLTLLNSGLDPTRSQYVSKRTRGLKSAVGTTESELENLISLVRRLRGGVEEYRTTARSLARMIDLWGDSVRR